MPAVPAWPVHEPTSNFKPRPNDFRSSSTSAVQAFLLGPASTDLSRLTGNKMRSRTRSRQDAAGQALLCEVVPGILTVLLRCGETHGTLEGVFPHELYNSVLVHAMQTTKSRRRQAPSYVRGKYYTGFPKWAFCSGSSVNSSCLDFYSTI